MAFLPILHNYSMLSGSVLYAAHKTKLLRNIGLIITPLSIAATFFLIGPREYGALNLGAVGLAVKMVAVEFIGNAIVLYFNSRMLALNFWRYLLHQVFVVVVLTAAAFAGKQGALYILGATAGNWLLVMVVGGLLYTAVSLLIFNSAPSLVGVDKREALAFLRDAMAKSQSSLTRNPSIP